MKIESRTLAMSEIHVDDAKNARVSYDDGGLKMLAASMKVDGLINPVTVRYATEMDKGVFVPNSPRYVLVAGYRRMKAAKALGWETIRATVLDPETRPADLAILNLNENLARRDLSTFEMAQAMTHIRDTFGLSGEEIAKRIKDLKDGKDGLSKGSVNNYMRVFDNLEHEIKEAWAAGHDKATISNLLKIVAMEDQLDGWNAICGISGAADDDVENDGDEGSEGDEGEPQAKRRPTPTNLALMLKAVKDSDRGEEWKNGAMAALKYALGKAKSVGGVKLENAKSGEE